MSDSDGWECPVCTVPNLPDALSCVACETPKAPIAAHALADEQKAALQAETKKQPLVGERAGLESLYPEYSGNVNFMRKLDDARKKYGAIRRIRGDGSCFYRAYLFAIAERMLVDTSLAESFLKRMEESIDFLVGAGYERFLVEDFYDPLVEVLQWIVTDKPSEAQLLAKFQDEELADHLPYYLRLLTAAYMKTNADTFTPLLVDQPSLEAYCRAEIEVPASECDSPQIMALSSVLHVPLRVGYLDQSAGGMHCHDFAMGTAAAPLVHLLYRPGHFDILYPGEASAPPGFGPAAAAEKLH